MSGGKGVARRMLITGGNGLLGREIGARFSDEYDVTTTDVSDCDVTDPVACERAIHSVRPDVVVHCAGYTAVDRAENDVEAAFALNAGGTGNIARACREHGSLLVTFGTDYIFDGTSGRPYVEEDEARPLSVYGRSKLAAEIAVRESGAGYLLIRTQWLFGRHGRNFVSSVLERANRGEELRVVRDQTGCPTYSRDLAEGVGRLLESGRRGVFHFSNEGETTFFDLASLVLESAVPGKRVLFPVSSKELPRDAYPAPRPAFSVLSKRKYSEATGVAPRPWQEAVLDFLEAEAKRRTSHEGGEAG